MQAINCNNLLYLRRKAEESGVMLMGLLILLAIMGLVVTKTAELWSTSLTREREQDLLFVGEQYRMAIERYYYASPGSSKVLPLNLEDLVNDNRGPKVLYHLRQPYLDPISNNEEWGLVKEGNRIRGVYSLSDRTPMKKSGFDPKYASFASANSYRGWRFAFRPAVSRPAASPASSAR